MSRGQEFANAAGVLLSRQGSIQSDLLQAQADIESRRVGSLADLKSDKQYRKGQLIGHSLSSLANLVPAIQERIAAEKHAQYQAQRQAEQDQLAARDRQLREAELGLRMEGLIDSRESARSAEEQRAIKDKIAKMTKLLIQSRPETWSAHRDALIREGANPDETPVEFDQDWIRQQVMASDPSLYLKETAPTEPAKPPDLVEGYGPTGEHVYVPKVAGVKVWEKPEPPKVVEDKPESRSIDIQAAEALIKGDTAKYKQLIQAKRELGLADDKPTLTDPAKEKELDDLVQAVIDNPTVYDKLTPSAIGAIAPRLNAKGFTGFGKPMEQAAIKSIAASKTSVNSLRDLRQVLADNEQYIGPLAGWQEKNPWSDARKAKAKIDTVRQRVGKALEGGVLRKEDEEKYKQILATLYDTPSTAVYKVDNLITDIERDIETFINEQRLGGRRVNVEKKAPAKPAEPIKVGPWSAVVE